MLLPAALPRLAMLVAFSLTVVMMQSAVAATTWNCGTRAQDEVFVINTRPSCCTTNAEQLAATLKVEEYASIDPNGIRRWTSSEFSRLTTSPGPEVSTIIYVHGNQITHGSARQRGLAVYRKLVRQAEDDRPVRFIIWSWPAAKVDGLLRDFRVKAARTRPVGWQLAWAIDQLPVDSPIGIVGYSYGARIVGGASHVLAGGDLSGLTLTERVHPNRPPYQVAFLAAATHAHWFGSNQYHGLAMTQIHQLWMTTNHKDPAMRFYSLSSKCSDPDAMGYCGPCCLDSETRHRITCCNVSGSVGRSHDLYKHIGSHRRMALIWQHLAGPTPAPVASVAAAN